MKNIILRLDWRCFTIVGDRVFGWIYTLLLLLPTFMYPTHFHLLVSSTHIYLGGGVILTGLVNENMIMKSIEVVE